MPKSLKKTKKSGASDRFDHLEKFRKHGRVYGTTTMGSRGQLVIPAKARQDFRLKNGEQMLIIGNRLTGLIGLIKGDRLEDFVSSVVKHLTEMGADVPTRERLVKAFRSAARNK